MGSEALIRQGVGNRNRHRLRRLADSRRASGLCGQRSEHTSAGSEVLGRRGAGSGARLRLFRLSSTWQDVSPWRKCLRLTQLNMDEEILAVTRVLWNDDDGVDFAWRSKYNKSVNCSGNALKTNTPPALMPYHRPVAQEPPCGPHAVAWVP